MNISFEEKVSKVTNDHSFNGIAREIVDCEVLEVDEPHLVSYTWLSVGESTAVTWTLKEESDGTVHLHFDQSGFSEETKSSPRTIDGPTYAWMNMGTQLEKVLAEL